VLAEVFVAVVDDPAVADRLIEATAASDIGALSCECSMNVIGPIPRSTLLRVLALLKLLGHLRPPEFGS
jgi:hypothetical protein